jgi:hypothetical protein
MKKSKVIDPVRRQQICNLIKEQFPSVYQDSDTLPQAYHGTNVSAIVLGADPVNVAYNKRFEYVFGLEKKNSPYFSVTKRNLKKIGLTLDNIYVQNVIQNYFKVETSNNKYWYECALLWLDYLKDEIDSHFDREVPVFVTAQKVLKALIGKEAVKAYPPDSIYSKSKFFTLEENYLGRNVFCLFRHRDYSLSKWKDYREALIMHLSAKQS